MQTDRLNRLSDLLFELTQQANDDDKPEVFGSSVLDSMFADGLQEGNRTDEVIGDRCHRDDVGGT